MITFFLSTISFLQNFVHTSIGFFLSSRSLNIYFFSGCDIRPPFSLLFSFEIFSIFSLSYSIWSMFACLLTTTTTTKWLHINCCPPLHHHHHQHHHYIHINLKLLYSNEKPYRLRY